MISRDCHKSYSFGEFSYKNFCLLDQSEIDSVYQWRNDANVRKIMMNTDIIPYDSHLAFVSSLKDKTDRYYWLVYHKGEGIGVLNVIDVDCDNGIGEPGFYLAPNATKRGLGIFMLDNYKRFLFDVIGFEMLVGHNYIDNINALQLSVFFGAEITGIIIKQNRKYFALSLSKNQFIRHNQNRLILDYVKFSKTNTISVDSIPIINE